VAQCRRGATHADGRERDREGIPGQGGDSRRAEGDIKVAINGNQVSLSAEIKDEQPAETGKGGALRSERYYGNLQRSFTLPQEVDDDQAQARYENGVLHLTLPKKVGSGGKQLSIQ
jgi:HSP20 family protein